MNNYNNLTPANIGICICNDGLLNVVNNMIVSLEIIDYEDNLMLYLRTINGLNHTIYCGPNEVIIKSKLLFIMNKIMEHLRYSIDTNIDIDKLLKEEKLK